MATQPVHMRQEGDAVHIAATQRGLAEDQGGYLWTGELGFCDNQVLTGWYAANDGSIRSKGTMYLFMKHPHGSTWSAVGWASGTTTRSCPAGRRWGNTRGLRQAMADLIREREAAR
jgi:hypothetical protein